MKKQYIIIAIVCLVIGLLLGKLFFGRSAEQGTNNTTTLPIEKKESYTCPMHPQIQQDEPGSCPICGMNLVPLKDNNSENAGPTKLVMTEDAVRLSNVETMIVGETEFEKNSPQKQILLTGRVKMDETASTSQTAHLNGRIEKLWVKSTGETVRKGQKIASIYSPELVSAQKELIEAAKAKDKYPELYKAAKHKLQLWKLTETTILDIEKEGTIKNEITIYADQEGIVMKKYIDNGDYVRKGMPLFDIMNLNKVWVLFDLYEKNLRWVEVGSMIEFNLDAMPEKRFKAPITFIDPIINPKTRVSTARVVISNYKNRLKPDMFAKGIVKGRSNNLSKKKNITIPKSAILWTGETAVIYIKDPLMKVPTFEYREVVLGEALKDAYVIEKGLHYGEEVVVNGVFRIDASAQLTNKSSMMNRHITVQGEENLTPDFSEHTPTKFKEQLTDLLESYWLLKDALVATDYEKTKKTGDVFSQNLNKVDMKLLKADAHIYWMQQEKGIKSHISALIEASDVEKQRKQFSSVSTLMIATLKAFGKSSDTYYVQHCPMALDDKGADWLSKEREILNPYFGDKMLKCGIVQDSL